MVWSLGEAGCGIVPFKKTRWINSKMWMWDIGHNCATYLALARPFLTHRALAGEGRCGILTAPRIIWLAWTRCWPHRMCLVLQDFFMGVKGNKLAGRCGHRLWSKIQCKLEAISKTDPKRYCKVCFDWRCYPASAVLKASLSSQRTNRHLVKISQVLAGLNCPREMTLPMGNSRHQQRPAPSWGRDQHWA